jgi:broad specificity phosphatase PhoE
MGLLGDVLRERQQVKPNQGNRGMQRRSSLDRARTTALAFASALLLGMTHALAQTPPQPATAATAAPTKAATANPQAQADVELIKALRAGGHAIVMRHAPADPDKADTDPLNFRNIKAQQPLTEAGRQAARAFGDALRALGAPIGEVLTSRYNRAYQTAVLAGFKEARPVTELTEGSLVTSPNEQRRRSSALKQLAAAPLAAGKNRLLVTHRANITNAFGKEWYEVKEGEATIFRIDNGAYSLAGRLQISDWSRLVGVVQP